MKNIRHLVATGSIVAATVGASLIGSHARGDVSVGFGERVAIGTLSLEIDSPGTIRVVFQPPTGAATTRSVTLKQSDKCLVDDTKLATLASLLTIETLHDNAPADLDVGLVNNGLGIRENNNCSTANGRLGANDGFRISLGSTFGTDVVIDRARLDVEGKFNARLGFTALDANGAPVVTSPAGGYMLNSSSADAGPDAGPGDNNDVPIGDPSPTDDFATLDIRTVAGELSLEGGGDWAAARAAHRSVFHLLRVADFEYALDCGDSVDDDLGDTGQAQSATIVRYDDLDGACEPIGADLDSDENGVVLRKTTADANGVEQEPYVRLRIVWAVPVVDGNGDPRPPADIQADLARQIDVDDGQGLKDVQWCTANNDPGAGSSGYDPTDPTTAVRADHPADGTYPDGIPWCLLDDHQQLVDGMIIQTQVYDGVGDPRWA